MSGAYSTMHSTDKALPAISLNSAPGSRDLISVATEDNVVSAMILRERKKVPLTSKHDAQISCSHQIVFTPLVNAIQKIAMSVLHISTTKYRRETYR